MKILTNEIECNKIIENSTNSILDSYGYKKILNSHYNPDAYLFFVDGKDIIPLVIKNNLVTFYGGTQHNHINSLPNNKVLLNDMLSYLKKEEFCFQLTSIKKDYFSLLEESNKYFDVPYPVEWHYKQVQHYDEVNLFEASSKNMKKCFKRIANRIQDYTFTTLTFIEFKAQFNVIIKKHIHYFSERGIESVWKDDKYLLLKILTYFNKEENLFIRLVKLKQDMVGIYILVYNNKEMIFYFISSLKKDNNDISQIMYLDKLQIAKQIATKTTITQLNGLRGGFTNKTKFGYMPVPLYALVNDDNWIVQTDSDIDPESYESVYGRSSWGRTKSLHF
ncbi:MAG: hypothetical protein KAI79_19840 [Bacteroidales bacterium]|nr:hypothetical protein [Bacteroidales bacterium]